jgi:hypothetical protein
MYIYKVTRKTVKLSNGETANVAEYAYKPYGYTSYGESQNQRMHFSTGCYAHERAAREGKRLPWVAIGTRPDATVYKFNGPRGTFSDYWADDNAHVPDVHPV